jgi:hypothetical protein
MLEPVNFRKNLIWQDVSIYERLFIKCWDLKRIAKIQRFYNKTLVLARDYEQEKKSLTKQ